MMKNYVSPVVEIVEVTVEDIVMISEVTVEASGSLVETSWGDLK